MKLASYAVDNMILNGDSNEIIGRYMTAESDNIKEAIADEYTGLYGFIRDEYIDGAGWVPDADFDPKSRPWYIETVSAGKKINFVRPYLDMQTNTVMMTISSLLSDQKSVVALDVSLGELQVITENIAKDCPGRLAFVLDDSGGVVAHTDKRQVEHNFIKETGTLGALIAKKIIDEGELRFEVTYGDITYIVYAEQLEDGWHCVAAMDIDEFYKTPRLITLVSFLVTITATLMFLMVIIRISKQHLFAKRMNRQLASVGSIYISMFDIDLKKNVFSEINNNIYTGYQKHCPASGNEAESGTADDKTAEIFNLPDELNHNKFKKMTDELVYKVLLLGDSSVGKTCFLLRYCDKSFQEAHLSTIGLDYRLKSMTLQNDKNIKLQIWDTAGQDRFRAITKNYYKGANGIILIYDVTNKQSYENVKNWLTQIKEEANPNVIIYLAGNKIDVEEEQRVITTEDGQKIADEYKLPFKETSAKNGINVNEIFQELVEKIDETFSKLEVPKGEQKNKLSTGGKRRKGCC